MSKAKEYLGNVDEAKKDWRSNAKFAIGRIEKALKFGGDMKSSSELDLQDAKSLLEDALKVLGK